MIKLVGMTGLARSGKDTAALYLNENCWFNSYAFAYPMKEACKVIFDWTEEHVNGDLKDVVDPRYGVSPRKALQTLGTEWGRGIINPSIWLIRAQAEIDSYTKLVITDVRFDNEAELIKSNGGIIIKVNREGVDGGVAAHTSESGIDVNLVDYVVENNSSIPTLHQHIEAIIGE